MGVVTKIEVCKKNKERSNIYVDDNFAFACSNEVIYYQRLEKNKEIDEKSLSKIILEDNYIKGKNKALKYIERSYKTEKQIYDYLLGKEYEEKTIARVMAFLQEYSFVDDKKYAEMYTKDRIKREGIGKIKFGLKNKGISEEIINNICESYSVENESESIRLNAEKKLKIILKSERDPYKVKRKLYDFLMRKGYNGGNISSVINCLMEDYKNEFQNEKEESSEDDRDIAYEVALKRYDILQKSENNQLKLKKKLNDFLLRKGYSYELVKSILNDILN